MNILIPMAGGDSFFPREDFHFPKPLIEIAGVPLIERVVANLTASLTGRPIFVARAEDCRQFSIDQIIRLLCGDDTEVLALDNPTRGAACSALMAVDHIDTDEPLIVSNGDQLIEADLGSIVADFEHRGLDAGVITFASVHPRWSYVCTGETGLVTEAAEKRVISRNAIAGFYYFRHGRDFVAAVKRMILLGDEVDGHYYIAPALNQMILQGRRVGHCPIPPSAYRSLYSPQKMREFEALLQEERRTGETAGKNPSVTVAIPMAGAGSRFAKVGYDKPKPFIDVQSRPMIGHVLDNLDVPKARYVLIAQQDHLDAERALADTLRREYNVSFVPISGLTEGAACTVLRARALIADDAPLLIANSDQLVDFDAGDFIRDCRQRGLDGSILAFRDEARDPKWSFARLDRNGLVAEVREKEPVSDLATAGIYLFMRGRTFLDAAIDMIARNERVNGEFYVGPVYNDAIAAGARIGLYEVPAGAMHGLGTPEDLDLYLEHVAG